MGHIVLLNAMTLTLLPLKVYFPTDGRIQVHQQPELAALQNWCQGTTGMVLNGTV